MIIDTHTHIFEKEFDDDRQEVILRAKDADVWKMVLPNIDVNSISRLKDLYSSDTNYFIPAMGLHPTEITTKYKSDLETVKKELENSAYKAVGEIGIDLYWDDKLESEQIEAFETQLSWAVEKDLPVLIHCRNAFDKTVNAVKNCHSKKGIFHCFGGTLSEAEEILTIGDFLLGIGGIVTFKKSSLPEVLKSISLDHIVLETDAPYLAPVPHRGKRNEPSFLTEIVTKLSEIYNVSKEDIKRKTSLNAASLLNIKI